MHEHSVIVGTSLKNISDLFACKQTTMCPNSQLKTDK